MRRLLLFDIDQTLIDTAGVGMRCLMQALRDVGAVTVDAAQVTPDGKTDPAILSEILTVSGCMLEGRESEVWRQYARLLEEALRSVEPRHAVKPGVALLLTALAADRRAHLGLLTGNREETARIKLARFDLHRYFHVGAYGCDSADRCALGPIALSRAHQHFGHAFTSHDTWIIGDTARDVQAARAFGARVLAVATGGASVEALRETGADVVLPNLADTAQVLRVLLS